MHHAIPPIHEEVVALKARLRHAHDGHKKPRLQMLSLLASRHAHRRQEVARLLGVPRHPIRRWLALDVAGGLEAILATSVPAGPPVSLAPRVLARLEQVLHRPDGCASYETLHQWVRRTHGVEVQDKTLSTIVRTRFKPKLNVARPTPPKTP
jgi:hypothetical protein